MSESEKSIEKSIEKMFKNLSVIYEIFTDKTVRSSLVTKAGILHSFSEYNKHGQVVSHSDCSWDPIIFQKHKKSKIVKFQDIKWEK